MAKVSQHGTRFGFLEKKYQLFTFSKPIILYPKILYQLYFIKNVDICYAHELGENLAFVDFQYFKLNYGSFVERCDINFQAS